MDRHDSFSALQEKQQQQVHKTQSPFKTFILKFVSILKSNALVILILTSIAGGIATGFLLLNSKETWSEREVKYIKFPGDVIVNCFQALMLPLITSSLITAVGSLDLSTSGKIGARAFAYYAMTSAIAVFVGICAVTTIRPGERGTKIVVDAGAVETVPVVPEDAVMDLVRNIFPDNLFEATMYHAKTVVIPPANQNKTVIPVDEWKMEIKKDSGINIMGLIAFSAIFGVSLSKLGNRGKPLLGVFTTLYEATRTLSNWLLWLSPIVVFSLVTAQMLEGRDLGSTLSKLGWYFLTVIVGLIIHGFVILPTIYGLVTRTLPFRFILNMSQALLTAFGTSSSPATIPVTIECLEKKNGVHPVVTRFVLLGATINMDGTALYEAVAPIFIAQILGVSYSFGNLLAVSVTATLASMGVSGIVAMMIVLNCLGLPVKYIYYIVPVDFLLGRFRTTVNVLGDAIGAGVLNHICRDDLNRMNIEEGK